jgi:hypothetical protein
MYEMPVRTRQDCQRQLDLSEWRAETPKSNHAIIQT